MVTHEPSQAGNRPVLNPSAIVLWRSAGVLQLELGDRRIVIEDVPAEHVTALLGRSDDRRTGRARASPRRPARTGRMPGTHPATQGAVATAGRERELGELTRVLAAAGFMTSGATPAQIGPAG